MAQIRLGTTETHSCRDKGVHAFLKGISPKVNGIMKLEFELVYNNIAVQHVRHKAMGIPHLYKWSLIIRYMVFLFLFFYFFPFLWGWS